MLRKNILRRKRRETQPLRRFQPVAFLLEERALLSISVNDPIGVSSDPAGDIFISHDASTATQQREAVEEIPASGAPAFNLFRLSGSEAHPGALVTLGSSATLPNLSSGAILELQPNGLLYAYAPSAGQVVEYENFALDSSDESNVFDVQTGTYRNLNATIALAGATFGDFDVSGSDLVVSAQSNGWDFVMRVSYSENGSGGVTESLTTLVASPASDSSAQPGGVAVNGQGTVLTTMPTSQGIDVPVAFNLLFDQGQAPAPEILDLGLSSQPTIESWGITTDDNGNFVAAAVTTSLLDADPGYVTITADLSTFNAKVTATDSTTDAPYVPWGVAVQPTTTGARLDGTIPTANLVLTGPSAYDPPFSGYTPTQIKNAYGLNQITFTGPDGTTIPGNGNGQTIVLMEEGYDPTIESDLEVFSQAYSLPGPTTGITFTQVYQTSENTFAPINLADPPPVNSQWINETSVDVEWAHAIAPEANIMVVDVDNNALHGLQYFCAAVQYAESQPGVSVVSMSVVFPEFTVTSNGTDDANMTQYDPDFQAANVTFLAASGDWGDTPDYYTNENTTTGVSYPASSPDVVAVGGTTLPLDANGDYPGTTGADAEVGWETNPNAGSGGGLSSAEPEPSWQEGVVPATLDPPSQDARAAPDVAWDSDPSTGVNVYTSTLNTKTNTIGWTTVGGTSIAAPQWAGLIAIVDQGRVLAGGTPLTGYDQTLPALYSLPSADFHDIVTVTNPTSASLQAGPGYDEVTGLGTPVANLLVPDLVSYEIASQVVVSTQPPSSVTAGRGFGLSVTVEDPFSNAVTDYNGSVTIALASGPNGATLGGTLTATAVDGVATFAGLTLNTAGTGYTLEATASGLKSATTSDFNVVPTAPAQLVISSEPPSSMTAGDGFGLSVAEEDPFGNPTLSFNGSVTIALASGPDAATLGGTLTATAVDGVATFSGLTLNTAGAGYALVATASGLKTATTSDVSVVPAAPAQLVIPFQPPSSVTTGDGFGLSVAAEDPFGNPTPSWSGSVTIALASGPDGATLGGTLTATAVDGVATFAGLILNNARNLNTLEATASGLKSATTSDVSVVPAAPAQLVISSQPQSSVTAGDAFGLSVAAEDPFGNPTLGFNGSVTIALASGPDAATLGGTLTATAVDGVATFAGLILNTAGTGYTLEATASGLKSATTSDFNVVPAAPAQLVISSEPPSSMTAEDGFGLSVAAEDPFGNPTPSWIGCVTIAMASGPDGATLGGTLTATAVDGVATFAGLTLNTAGTGYTLEATASGLKVANTTLVDVVPAAAARLVIAAQPLATVVSGSAIGLRVVAEDPFGNIDPNFNGAVTVALAKNPSGSTLSGTLTTSAAQGTATFAGLSLNDAGDGFTLQISSSGLASATTIAFNVAPAPTPPKTAQPSPPTIILEQVLTKQKTNKKGKPVGKPVFLGFTLKYSTAMNPSTAGLGANYQLEATMTKRIKKKTIKVLQPINFTAAYASSDESVTLMIVGNQKFAKGGQIAVVASGPGAVSSATGVLLDPTDTVFSILAHAKGITPG